MSNDVIGAITEVSTKSHRKREGSREEGRNISTGFKEEVRHELSFDKGQYTFHNFRVHFSCVLLKTRVCPGYPKAFFSLGDGVGQGESILKI